MQLIKSTNGGTCEFSMKGRFTFSDNQNFKQIINAFSDEAVRNVVINLSGVEFLDSAALGMLLLARDESEKSGKSLVLSSPNGQIKKMFEVSRFYEIFNVN